MIGNSLYVYNALTGYHKFEEDDHEGGDTSLSSSNDLHTGHARDIENQPTMHSLQKI